MEGSETTKWGLLSQLSNVLDVTFIEVQLQMEYNLRCI